MVRKRVTADQRHALILLARSPMGRTETFMLLHGCTPQLLGSLILAKLVTASKTRVGRGRQIEVIRMRITDAGRHALAREL
jgi:hypothetical protein